MPRDDGGRGALDAETARSALIEITGFVKIGGPLTKRISLSPDGGLRSDGSACVMSRGVARRLRFKTLSSLLHSSAGILMRAIALGAMRLGLPKAVEVVAKFQLEKLRPDALSDLIARTREYLDYRPGVPALALIDFDTKGIPQGVQDRIETNLEGPSLLLSRCCLSWQMRGACRSPVYQCLHPASRYGSGDGRL